jgi:hypothetical protein
VFRIEAGRDDYEWDVACIRNGVARCKERSFIWRGNIPIGLGDSKTTYMATERIKMWSDNMDHAFTFGGMACVASQIAVMLGFTELIMIGMDGNYKAWSGKDVNHYSESYCGDLRLDMTAEKADIINRELAEMRKFVESECAERGVRVRYEDTRNYTS